MRMLFVDTDGSVTPGPLPQPVYLNVPTWLVAVVGSVVVAVIVALKAADYRCSVVAVAVSASGAGERCCRRRCIASRRMRAGSDRPTSFRSLASGFQALVRLVFSFVITTRMYYVDPAKWTYLWVHVGAVCVGVCMSVVVVTTFFRLASQSGITDALGSADDQNSLVAGPSSRISALADWYANNATIIRVVRMVAIVKPGVLFVLQSGVSAALDMPVAAWHPSWRYVHWHW